MPFAVFLLTTFLASFVVSLNNFRSVEAIKGPLPRVSKTLLLARGGSSSTSGGRGSSSTPRPALTRDFIRDVAILSEQLIMFDMPTEKQLGLSAGASREVAAPFFPDRIAEIEERPGFADCPLVTQRAEWRSALDERRALHIEDFIDTAQGTEKAAAVLLWRSGLGDAPTIVVAFRGSKSANDWLFTNAKFASPRCALC